MNMLTFGSSSTLPLARMSLLGRLRTTPRYGAHAMSLRHCDRIRDDLTAALRRHVKRFPEDSDLVAYVEGVDLPDSALVSLHRSDLWEITSRFAAIELLVSHEMEAIHRRPPRANTGPAADPPSPGTPPNHRAHPLRPGRPGAGRGSDAALDGRSKPADASAAGAGQNLPPGRAAPAFPDQGRVCGTVDRGARVIDKQGGLA
jgi:hypothetical protein